MCVCVCVCVSSYRVTDDIDSPNTKVQQISVKLHEINYFDTSTVHSLFFTV